MKSNARKASLALPGVTGTARVGRPTSEVLPRLRPGDIAVIDQPDLDRDTALALVDAGVRAVVNSAPMISGRYANLGPEVLAEAGVLLVDRVGAEALDRIPDDHRIRVHGGGVYAVGPDGQAQELALGRVVDLDGVHDEMELPGKTMPEQLEALARSAAEFVRHEHALLLQGRGLPRVRTPIAGRAVVVVGTPDHGELQAIGPFVREQAPVLIAVGAAADDLMGLSWVPDIVVVTAADAGGLPSADALRVATDVVLVAPHGSGLEVQATIEAVAGPPRVLETTATTEDVALLLAVHEDASMIVGVGLDGRLATLFDGHETGRASSFATRLEVGDRLVDARTVGRLYTGRPGALGLFSLVFAGLVALFAAVAVTPAGQGWAHDLVDYFRGLT